MDKKELFENARHIHKLSGDLIERLEAEQKPLAEFTVDGVNGMVVTVCLREDGSLYLTDGEDDIWICQDSIPDFVCNIPRLQT